MIGEVTLEATTPPLSALRHSYLSSLLLSEVAVGETRRCSTTDTTGTVVTTQTQNVSPKGLSSVYLVAKSSDAFLLDVVSILRSNVPVIGRMRSHPMRVSRTGAIWKELSGILTTVGQPPASETFRASHRRTTIADVRT